MILLISIGFIFFIMVSAIILYKITHKEFKMTGYQKIILLVMTFFYLFIIYDAL